jgi:hypothetical protein
MMRNERKLSSRELQMIIAPLLGTLSAYLVGAFYDHTARALATTVASFAALALATSDLVWLRGGGAD